jgi:hypothetical protein
LNPPAVDWTAPWLAPYRAQGEQVMEALAASVDGDAPASGDAPSIADTLNACLPRPAAVPIDASRPIRFVPQAHLPPGEPYERFIFETGAIPTRDNLHDLFNGLVWLTCPLAKRRLNELQAAEIARCGIGATRGPLRDALTLFDENGAVLDAPPALWRALVERDWQGLFVTRRHLWREARLRVFGHALLEKLVTPRKSITAHVLLSASGSRRLTDDDAALAAVLDPAHLRTKPFAPLPVLGVPLWWAGNSETGFYDDADVFRPLRRLPPTTTPEGAPSAGRRCPPSA